MKIYRLAPIDLRNKVWLSVSLDSHRGAVIVRAKDERTARRACVLGFGGLQHLLRTPIEVIWNSPRVISCETFHDPAFSADGPTAILVPHIADEEINAAIEQLSLPD